MAKEESKHLTPSTAAMITGWLWWNNDPKLSLGEKVELGGKEYRAKFGRHPNICYVNERAIAGDEDRVGRIKIVAAPNILVNHFWFGVKERQVG